MNINDYAKPGFEILIDSYGWNGAPPPASASLVRGLYVLNSDNRWVFYNRDMELEAAQEAGWETGVFHVWRMAGDQDIQAAWLVDHLPPGCRLPLVIDCEDKQAIKGLKTVTALRAFWKNLLALYKGQILTYTAPWWWDAWVKPYDGAMLPGLPFSPYDHPLWVCDVPPDDPHLPGRWTSWVMRQIAIDVSFVGFNARADIDLAEQKWFRSFLGPPPPTLEERVADLERRVTALGG
jgi:hypothetical protein